MWDSRGTCAAAAQTDRHPQTGQDTYLSQLYKPVAACPAFRGSCASKNVPSPEQPALNACWYLASSAVGSLWQRLESRHVGLCLATGLTWPRRLVLGACLAWDCGACSSLERPGWCCSVVRRLWQRMLPLDSSSVGPAAASPPLPTAAVSCRVLGRGGALHCRWKGWLGQ